MKLWIAVFMLAVLVVPAMASTSSTQSVDVTCTIDDYVKAGIFSDGNLTIDQSNPDPLNHNNIDTFGYAATSGTTQIGCRVEANGTAHVTITATPFVMGTDALKTQYKVDDAGAYNGFGGAAGNPFNPAAFATFGANTIMTTLLVPAVQTLGTFSMTPAAGSFEAGPAFVAGARSLEWSYTLQAFNQTLAGPTVIALAGVYTSTWTLTIAK